MGAPSLGGEAVSFVTFLHFRSSAALLGSCSVPAMIMSKPGVPSRVSDHLQVKRSFPVTSTGIPCPRWSELMFAKGYWKN